MADNLSKIIYSRPTIIVYFNEKITIFLSGPVGRKVRVYLRVAAVDHNLLSGKSSTNRLISALGYRKFTNKPT